jgi:hypothetical protein
VRRVRGACEGGWSQATVEYGTSERKVGREDKIAKTEGGTVEKR